MIGDDLQDHYFQAYWRAVCTPLPRLKETFEAELDFLKAVAGGDYSVLDVGCGIARPLKDLAPFVKTAVGIDNDPRMLDEAKRRAGSMPNLSLVRCDALDLCFPDSSVDFAYSSLNTIGAIDKKDRQRFVGEMCRVLRPGGKAINITWQPGSEVTEFLMGYYSWIGLNIIHINNGTTQTSAGTFDRMSLEEMKSYYENAGLPNVCSVNIGSLFVAYVGFRARK
jgi:ubiquinone/menaquinone biosynthesis C-methylase UbiE